MKRIEAKVQRLLHSAVLVACLLLASGAGAELRTLETVGTLPLSKKNKGSVIPRDAAIEQALREGVIRIAQEFLADRPLEDTPTGESGEGPEILTLPGEGATGSEEPDLAAEDAAREAEQQQLESVLGKKMVPYTTRFRVIEDRGRRPALFSDDPEVTEEYVVIVEVQVDVERVRTRLVDAGMIDPRDAPVLANDVLLEVDGLARYGAYVEFRKLLVEGLGAQAAVPVEMSSGKTVFDVSTESTAVEFLETLLTTAPPHLSIEPVHASGGRLRVAVDWQPPAEQGEGGASPGAGAPADL